MLNNLKLMKKNHPDLFMQFIFGIAIAFLSGMQVLMLLLFLCFYS